MLRSLLMPPAMQHRSELLDCVRAVAVILVLVFHVATRFIFEGLDPVAQWFARYGFLGVDIFFPLSGFLITGFLLRHSSNQAIGAFFLRRFFRIVPLYFLALLVFVVGVLITGEERHLLDRVWINGAFLTGWYIFWEGKETVPYTITWSLSVEEFAYILFGLVAWVMRKQFVTVLVLFTVFPLALRFYLASQGAEDIYYFPPARLDSIAVGGLVAVAHYHGRTALLPLLGALAASLVLPMIFGEVVFKTLFYLQVTLATCVVITACQTYASEFRSVITRPFAVIGFYSYFIYLFHFFIIYGLQLMEELTGQFLQFWAFCALAMGLTLIAAIASYALFEGPLMRYGRSLEAKRPREPQSA